MRYRFEQIFKELPDGRLTPKRRLRVGGVELGPGVIFSKGVSFSGIDFTLFRGHDIEAEEENGVLVIKGIYK